MRSILQKVSVRRCASFSTHATETASDIIVTDSPFLENSVPQSMLGKLRSYLRRCYGPPLRAVFHLHGAATRSGSPKCQGAPGSTCCAGAGPTVRADRLGGFGFGVLLQQVPEALSCELQRRSPRSTSTTWFPSCQMVPCNTLSTVLCIGIPNMRKQNISSCHVISVPRFMT